MTTEKLHETFKKRATTWEVEQNEQGWGEVIAMELRILNNAWKEHCDAIEDVKDLERNEEQ